MTKKLKIAALKGGDSSEREISMLSAENVLAALDREKYEIYEVDVHGGRWTCTLPDGTRTPLDRNDFSLTVDGRKTPLDYALILIHGTPGEDGKLQGYLEMTGIPYSTCDMVSSVLTFDKKACKRSLEGTGIALARDIFIRRGESADPAAVVAELGLPLFVKPNASGSSFGVTKVTAAGEIPAAIEAAFEEGDAVLIEEAVEGRELSCGVMSAGDRDYIFPVTEIVPRNGFFDYKAKYAGNCDEITPADLDPATLAAVNDLTLKSYKACGCRGVARVECILRGDGVPVFLEINSVPGLTRMSIIPQQAAAMGMTLGEMFDVIIADTCHPRK